ncbi:hypothetical protein C7Y69_01500 [Alteromonas sp. KS69]|jgi:hypothetical protein|uniref:Uncharacterized protein n=1 Tax=Alteromonas naphthalenivorans TaxID=715451 RepID=F5Z9V0_ALTNA|nr:MULTISPECIES: hypothetical protein [Alteromonas]AEF02105.1 hypothetical protein ambt_02755 [Alteromonas naphthalenivorans]MBB66520.1 hypothetical protein [Rickettsiales bacterium]MBO7924476.1 hypothetical protein [Alteromonas sp. K632G]RUP83240.1 hypothetical protein C7Y69_01500 [Alteromonas sp. KS69]|tara:strand:+ start:6956 stop:7495 length:540 start_codon:yes stop_codon:yes gene_type:complete
MEHDDQCRKIAYSYTLNLSVFTDNLLEQTLKEGEGTAEGETYFFKYEGKGFSNGILSIPQSYFADGDVRITILLNQTASAHKHGPAGYKFAWIHARRAGDKEEYVGRGQRFEMESWQNDKVSFLLTGKMQYKTTKGWVNVNTCELALDVWVHHTYRSQLTKEFTVDKINCDPQIEIQPS